MKVERLPVVFLDADPEYGAPEHRTCTVINDTWVLDVMDGCEWLFYKITSRTCRLKNPVVDLEKCQRFTFCMDAVGDIGEILNMTLFEVVERYAK